MYYDIVTIWTIVLCFSSPEWTDKWTLEPAEYYAIVIVLIQWYYVVEEAYANIKFSEFCVYIQRSNSMKLKLWMSEL